jgi:hypothetical protein
MVALNNKFRSHTMTNIVNMEELVSRITKLEEAVFAPAFKPESRAIKQRTLAELIKGKTLKNGQEKVAVIVGYYERMLGKESVTPDDMREGWKQARFNGAYAPILLARAEGDGLVSNYGHKGNYVLTITGEEFYQSIAQ